MTEESKKLEQSSLIVNKVKKALTILVGVGVIWYSGFMTYGLSKGLLYYPEPYGSLYNRKTELTRKIAEWNRFIPLMKEQFASQCKDSLEKAVKDTTELNLKMAEIKQEHDKLSGKEYWSWLGFFME
mgnify:CR=1 FL=1